LGFPWFIVIVTTILTKFNRHITILPSDVSEKKTVLNNVSGSFHKNQVGAILGCSGSGKSTLMNILSGYM
jgi:ABC-type multidrug transport system ATPase subunit